MTGGGIGRKVGRDESGRGWIGLGGKFGKQGPLSVTDGF